MKIRNIALLAAAVMVIMATGMGNAFATSWSGTDQSNNNNGAVSWYSKVGGTPTVSGGSALTWENGFYNVGTNSYYASLLVLQNGNIVYSDGASSLLGHYGYWWPDTASVNAESSSGSHTIKVQHWWGVLDTFFDHSVTYDQPYTVS